MPTGPTPPGEDGLIKAFGSPPSSPVVVPQESSDLTIIDDQSHLQSDVRSVNSLRGEDGQRVIHLDPASLDGDLPELVKPSDKHALGPFRILEFLGQGGMGAVFRARHERRGDEVALKVLMSRYTEDEEVSRKFVNSSRIVQRLRHPFLVPVIDVGFDRGHFFYSMELLSGATLADLVRKRGPVPEPAAISWMAAMASALALLHRHNLIHADIKPDNIMLDERQRPRLGDLSVTQVGGMNARREKVFGTRGYAPPELEARKSLDERSDIFSLGATFSFAVTGKPPSEDLQIEHFLFQTNKKKASALEQRPGAHAGFTDLITRCLETEPTRRPATAQIVLAELKTMMKKQ